MAFRLTVIAALMIVTATALLAYLPTFDRRCAEAFERNSSAWEMCVERLSSGNGGVRFVRKITLVPVEK